MDKSITSQHYSEIMSELGSLRHDNQLLTTMNANLRLEINQADEIHYDELEMLTAQLQAQQAEIIKLKSKLRKKELC